MIRAAPAVWALLCASCASAGPDPVPFAERVVRGLNPYVEVVEEESAFPRAIAETTGLRWGVRPDLGMIVFGPRPAVVSFAERPVLELPDDFWRVLSERPRNDSPRADGAPGGGDSGAGGGSGAGGAPPSPATVNLPGIGPVPVEYALLPILILTLCVGFAWLVKAIAPLIRKPPSKEPKP